MTETEMLPINYLEVDKQQVAYKNVEKFYKKEIIKSVNEFPTCVHPSIKEKEKQNNRIYQYVVCQIMDNLLYQSDGSFCFDNEGLVIKNNKEKVITFLN